MNHDDDIDCCEDHAFFATHIVHPHLHKLWLMFDGHISEHIFEHGPAMEERIANG